MYPLMVFLFHACLLWNIYDFLHIFKFVLHLFTLASFYVMVHMDTFCYV